MLLKFKNPFKFLAWAFFFILLFMELVVLSYSSNYYRASDRAVAVSKEASVSEKGSYYLVKPPKDVDTRKGVVFYPGGKVEMRAYLPMAKAISEKGYTVALCRMPFNLAFFDMDAYEAPVKNTPVVDEWYILGHSLGGVAAGTCFNSNTDKFSGLILLGSYPLKSVEPEKTLVVYGTQDKNMKTEKIHEKNTVVKLEGGNHAQFGDYGIQAGDGKASMSRKEQQRITAEEIDKFIRNLD